MERQAITVHGVVQGVGFRPFVFGLASRLRLNGFVKNRAGSVLVEIEGEHKSLDQFLDELQTRPPPLSRIDDIERRPLPVQYEQGFRIEQSDSNSTNQVFISPDVATCDECLAEHSNPTDRRYRYPFLNCTNCGPRLTIIQGAPYDRERTTMASFQMCAKCRTEYEDPSNRRFHAQPTACPQCGPRLELHKQDRERIEANNALDLFVEAIVFGKIGAIKGLGGFHLVCDARNDESVRELRQRKHRDEKPFAVMIRDVAAARSLCDVDSHEEELLNSPRRPIVLLRKLQSRCSLCEDSSRIVYGANNDYVCEAVAPGNPFLGVMLPYTPLHHLLLDAVQGVPLVMTSGNRSDEPIAYLNEEAMVRLSNIADVFLMHDRSIHVRCDDSVTRMVDGEELPVRRSRGYAPQPIKLALECPGPMLAVGGQFKGVFALGRDRQAFLSHHMGDLNHFDAYRAFKRDIDLYEQLFDIHPQLIVHDLHPDYASTLYARTRAADQGIESLPVQHHHAHMASCMAEHDLDEPVIGVSLDGTGYGTDGAIWGGEFFVGDYAQFSRAAHLRYVRMPGGDKAIREPWRMAAAHLLDAGCDPQLVTRSVSDGFASKSPSPTRRVTTADVRTVEQMVDRGFNSPWTSSAGRLFDAVAAIAGVRSRVSYEGQAAMELEWLATDVSEDGAYPFDLADVIDTRPLIRAVMDDVRKHVGSDLIARRFHSTVVEIIVAACRRIRSQAELQAVVLSGGVFMNALLTREVSARLVTDGFRVYRHRLVPPNDGGLCLGQLAIAAKASITPRIQRTVRVANNDYPQIEHPRAQAACT